MTISHPAPSPASAGSVLDGDPRVLIPLPEASERLGISRWQAYKLARSGRLPTTRLGARDLHVPAAQLTHELHVVVAGDAQGRPGPDHVPHQTDRVEDARAAVHQVADEDGLATPQVGVGPVPPEG